MRTKKVYCRKGCGHAAFANEKAERMHFHRVHSGQIPTGYRGYRRAKILGLDQPAKRRYTRRTDPHLAVQINYCPQCGCCLKTVAIGMATAQHTG